MSNETYIPDLPLEKISIGKGQVRMTVGTEALDELVESIRVQGLLEPIIVFEAEGEADRYEVIAGQRRFLASQKLGSTTIKALIRQRPADIADAKAMSLTENLLRVDPNRADTIDACTDLYLKYGSTKIVAQKTGLPEKKVKEFVKTARLIEPLKELVMGGLEVQSALRAQDAATASDGTVNEDEALVLAKELGSMSGAQQKKVVQKRQEQPGKDIDELIEDAKTGDRVVQIIVTMSGDAHTALKQYAADEGTTLDDAARSLIESGLMAAGGNDAVS